MRVKEERREREAKGARARPFFSLFFYFLFNFEKGEKKRREQGVCINV